MLGQQGGHLLHFGRIVDRVLAAVLSAVRRLELLSRPGEFVIGRLNVTAGCVKRLGETFDRRGVTSVQLFLDRPGSPPAAAINRPMSRCANTGLPDTHTPP